jgi:hypothetical protein
MPMATPAWRSNGASRDCRPIAPRIRWCGSTPRTSSAACSGSRRRPRTSQVDGYVASSIKINSGFPQSIGPMLVYHNTLLTTAPGTEAISLLPSGTATGIVLRNNILAGTRYAVERYDFGDETTLVWNQDYDLLHTTDAARFVRWRGNPYATPAAFYAGTGNEQHGIEQPPNLANPAGGDFTPLTGSAAIDAGVVLANINDGFVGGGPDIGAIELSALFADGFESP